MKAAMLVCTSALAAPLASGAPLNRCATPDGKVHYTERSCASAGARHVRTVREDAVSVVSLPFQKSPRAPRLTFCYDDSGAREDAPLELIEKTLTRAMALWAARCHIHFTYLGACARVPKADYPVAWGGSGIPAALATGSPQGGIRLNPAALIHNYPHVMLHELGHVIGIAHSPNRGDAMYGRVDPDNRLVQIALAPGARADAAQGPSANDYTACNKAVELRLSGRKDPFR